MIISDLPFFEDASKISGICGGDYYGAVAFSSSTDDRGYSWNYSTLRAAENRALQECESVSGATDCSLDFYFRSTSPNTGVVL